MSNSIKVLGTRINSRVERKKEALARDIAKALGLPSPHVSNGSSVDSRFLDEVYEAVAHKEPIRVDTYRMTERLLQSLGLTYDPFWDTSESQGKTGGGTVTNRAFSRVRSVLLGEPRCFLIAASPSGSSFEYDSTDAGHMALNDAGPGSRVTFYGTHFESHAQVHYVRSGWSGPWELELDGLTAFAEPLPVSGLAFRGGGALKGPITEISYETYTSLVAAAGGANLPAEIEEDTDPGGDVAANRIATDLQFPEIDLRLDVPFELPSGEFELAPAAPAAYRETEDGDSLTTSDLPPAPRDRAKSKVAEVRAVELATAALELDGWNLQRDCQRDGVGYDLLFVKGSRELHVEVKGIMGRALAFNLTPKEAWRVETDEKFVVVAVTNVLSPVGFRVHLITRDKLAVASRVITGYRLRL